MRNVKNVTSLFRQQNIKKSHNFLKHYKDGKELISDEKPISIVEIGNNIRKYEINFREHSSFYDFFNSEKVVDDFLSNARRNIKRSNEYFLIRCGFSIEIFNLFWIVILNR